MNLVFSPRRIHLARVEFLLSAVLLVSAVLLGVALWSLNGTAGAQDPPPATPGGFSGVADGDDVLLTWDVVAEADIEGYIVHRDYQYLAWQPGRNNTQFVDNGLNLGQTYRWQVRARDLAGQYSPPAPRVKITMPADETPPSPVRFAIANHSPDTGYVSVVWDFIWDDDVAGYLVHRDDEFVSWEGGFLSEYYDDLNPVPGAEHCYKIRAQGTNGLNSTPTTTCVQIPSEGPPPTPEWEFVGPADIPGAIYLSWEQVDSDPSIAGYLVHRDYQYRAWIPGNEGEGSYLDSDVVSGQTYRYQVRAQNSAKENSAPTPLASYTLD